jgi:hypothetical protein
MRAFRVCAALCLGLLAGNPTPLLAQREAPAVSVGVDACVPVDHDKLERLLAIELGTSAAHAAAGTAPTHVEVSCAPEGIVMRLEDGLTGRSMSRTLPASSFTDASSTRLLALAVAEFVVASWIELNVARSEPAVEPVAPRADPEAEAAHRAQDVEAERVPGDPKGRAPHDARVSLGPSLQLWSSHDALLLGASARVIVPLWQPFVWTLAFDLHAGSADVPFGHLGLVGGSLALALALRLTAGDFAFYLGPGGRLGFTRIDARPADPAQTIGDDFLAANGGPLWLSRIEARAGARLRFALDLEVGAATLPVRAEADDGRNVFEIDGLWITTVLSAGYAF